MSQVYVANMWLSCGPETSWTQSETEAALLEFDTRWTRDIEREWCCLVYNWTSINEQDFRAFLNQVLSDQFLTTMRKDIGDAKAVFNDQFYGSWAIGSGGLHQAHKLVSVKKGDSTDDYWSFQVTSSLVALVYVHAEWTVTGVN